MKHSCLGFEDQARAIFQGWGLPRAHAGINAHSGRGGSRRHRKPHLAPYVYRQQITSGAVLPAATFKKIMDRSAVAVFDGGGGFGHPVSLEAAKLAADKARSLGVGAVAVRNSHHYGAAGLYVRRIAERGLLGLTTTAVWRPAIVPTAARRPMLGTNPIAFAAPARRNRPFLLDMATSTAAGKLRTKLRGELASRLGFRRGGGRDPELPWPNKAAPWGEGEEGGHKGLAVVEILSTILAGATFAPAPGGADNPRRDTSSWRSIPTFSGRMGVRRGPGQAVTPSAPSAAVCERSIRLLATRNIGAKKKPKNGIPLPRTLVARLREIASEAGAPFFLVTAEKTASRLEDSCSNPLQKNTKGRNA